MDYAHWVEEHIRKLSELRAALANNYAGDAELRCHVDSIVGHYDKLFRFKGIAVKSDVFHVMSGMWKTPTERCFMWMGGFRPSELLKVCQFIYKYFCMQMYVPVNVCIYLFLYIPHFLFLFSFPCVEVFTCLS